MQLSLEYQRGFTRDTHGNSYGLPVCVLQIQAPFRCYVVALREMHFDVFEITSKLFGGLQANLFGGSGGADAPQERLRKITNLKLNQLGLCKNTGLYSNASVVRMGLREG